MRKAFVTLKEKLCAQPILQYADTTKGYTLYTDASKYGWAGVLTQLHTTEIEGKTITTDHLVAYVSGLFRGSQINWAALMKEAYAIYMAVKKLSFYLTDAEVLLKSDHLPLKKFLQKNTLNNKVNNWAMELEAFNIKFQHVSGKTNILADTLSRLVDIDPDARLDPETQDGNLVTTSSRHYQSCRANKLHQYASSVRNQYHTTRPRPTRTFHTSTNITFN